MISRDDVERRMLSARLGGQDGDGPAAIDRLFKNQAGVEHQVMPLSFRLDD